MRIAATACVALAWLWTAADAPAHAQKLKTISHRVVEGDTLQLLAAEYYGNRQHAVFIMTANGLTHPRTLRVTERIKIPRQLELVADQGDTLASMSRKHMGDSRRAEFLAEFNSIPRDATLTAGQRIVIPFHVKHRAAALETIEEIAAAYLGQPSQAKLLRRYNFTNKQALQRGKTLVIPIFNVRVRAERLPARDRGATERENRLRANEAKTARILPIARSAWRSGDYRRTRNTIDGEAIDLDYLPFQTAAELGLLWGSAHIALEDDGRAIAVFRQLLARKRSHKPDPYLASPAVIKVWNQALDAVKAELRSKRKRRGRRQSNRNQ